MQRAAAVGGCASGRASGGAAKPMAPSLGRGGLRERCGGSARATDLAGAMGIDDEWLLWEEGEGADLAAAAGGRSCREIWSQRRRARARTAGRGQGEGEGDTKGVGGRGRRWLGGHRWRSKMAGRASVEVEPCDAFFFPPVDLSLFFWERRPGAEKGGGGAATRGG